jgi:hypothetical protein
VACFGAIRPHPSNANRVTMIPLPKRRANAREKCLKVPVGLLYTYRGKDQALARHQKIRI